MNGMIRLIASIIVLGTSLCIGARLHAQSSGPMQPEFAVPSAPAGPQVNTFTGGFSFGIPVITVPGPHGSDYTINLSYYSGTSPEQGASWVGYGWSLNPGAVVREVRGFPDDWKDTVQIWNKAKKNWQASGLWRTGIEAFSDDRFNKGVGELGYQQSTIYSSHTGYRRGSRLGAEAKGIGDLSYTIADGEGSWRGRISPYFLLSGLRYLNMFQPIGCASAVTSNYWGKTALLSAGTFLSKQVGANEWDPSVLSSPRYFGSSKNYGMGLTYNALLGIPVGIEGADAGNSTSRISIPTYRTIAYGLMYGADAGESDMLDYHVEKLGDFSLSNSFLPIPFSAADNFFITGGASTGTMRLHTRRSGEFRPDSTRSEMSIGQDVPEMGLGLEIGFGAAFGVGSHSFQISRWDVADLNAEYRFEEAVPEETIFFRRLNDLGGNVLKAHDDAAIRAELNDNGEPKIGTNIFALMNEGERSGRSTHVGFSLNSELRDTTSRGVYYRAHEKRPEFLSNDGYIYRSENAVKDQIGEITVTGSGGSRYVYGLPVYARNEQRLNLGMEDVTILEGSRIKSKHLAYAYRDTANAVAVIGDERRNPYATAHLLTSITSPDYIDVTNNGPTPDDAGGYVKFNYRSVAGTTFKGIGDSRSWFHWRSPYRGLYYSRNQLSDPADDMGSYTAGEREQYYLKSVETKTHIAYFVTNKTNLLLPTRTIKGSLAERLDNYQAPSPLDTIIGQGYDTVAAGDSTVTQAHWLPLGNPNRTPNNNHAERLERIELYTKDENGDPDSLLTAVFLEYDYPLRPGLPNSAPIHKDSTSRVGMLTLRKIWSQHQGIYHARISPYEFGYEYQKSTDYPVGVRTLYPQIAGYADSLSSAEQNPSYTPFDLDRWGSYQANGAVRYAAERPWVDQNPNVASFDPAAWQLKWIRTPSQGEMHVQYEQNDYSYVQDKAAMAMVSIKKSFALNPSYDNNNDGKYYLNMEELGIADTNRSMLYKYKSALQKMFMTDDNRIYLRFLYALIGDTAKFDNPEYNSEYITAHAKVKSVGVQSILDGSVTRYALYVELGITGDYTVPKRVCLDLVKWNKRGRLAPGHPITPVAGQGQIADLVGKYSEAEFIPGNHCKAVDYANSYFRIPLLAPKKGGGIRVKRLLTLDRGTGRDTAFYGSEYLYEKYDDERRELVSSGVAANEPATGREENALVTVDLIRGKAEFDTKIISGEDRAQYEGPLGESLLPGASVGYGRVVVKNIHAGRTNPGFAVNEYFTAREFPYIRFDSLNGKSVDYTEIGTERDPESPLWSVVSGAIGAAGGNPSKNGEAGGGVTTQHNDARLTQGYRFILNAMHGAPKSMAAYGGNFESRDSWALSSLAQYGYYQPGEKVPVVDRLGDTIGLDHIGKEMEVTFESRAIKDHTTDVTVQADVSFPPTPSFEPMIWSVSAQLEILNNDLRTHVTSKVIRYPVIQKSVLTYGDGIYHMAENVAFDRATGSPIITRTVDGYDKLVLEQSPSGHRGTYHSYAFPVSQIYPSLGQKAINERELMTSGGGLTITKSYLGSGNASLTVAPEYDARTYSVLAKLFPGDLIRLTKSSNGAAAGFYHVASTDGRTVSLLPVSPTRFAAYDTSQGTVNIEVIESGRRNQVAGAVGGVVTYGEHRDSVAAGLNFIKAEPLEFADRHAVVNTLNAVLAQGGGIIPPWNLQPGGITYRDTLPGGGDTCVALGDSIRLKIESGRLIISRGQFIVNDSICGTIGSPHPLVGHLNAYLDSAWGFRIDTSLGYASQCDSTDYKYRRYNTRPAAYKSYVDSMFAARFDYINFRDNYWIGDIARPTINADTVEAFKRGTNTYYSAMGVVNLGGIIVGHSIAARYWVSDCDTSNKIKQISFRRASIGEMIPLDVTSTYTTRTKAQIDSLFPFTTIIGKFGQDGNGYLQYTNIYDNQAPTKIFGVRFIHSDTLDASLVCSDTLVNVGGNGRFDIDDDGAIIFIAADENVPVQIVGCFELCPALEGRYHTLPGVIAASASLIADSVTIDTAVYAGLPSDGNPYERGTRGKWRSQSNYVYRAPIVGGSRRGTTERTYNRAGVIENFKLFNWDDLSKNDSTRWLKSDSVTRYSPNSEPLEIRSPLGIYSATKLGYDNMLPLIAAYNAEHDAIAFTSFEDGDPENVTDSLAHAGHRSLDASSEGPWGTGVRFKVTQQIIDRGALVKLWIRYPDTTLPEFGASPLALRFDVNGVSTPRRNLRPEHRIARTGEWTLFEYVEENLDSLGADVEILFDNGLDSQAVYVDDIKVQPVDAAATCLVYDPITFRTLAVFDDDHFGAYPQYNAEGAAVRTRIETARGIKTVAEAHGHLPSKSRTAAIGPIAGRKEEDDGASYSIGRRTKPRSYDSPETDGINTKQDLLDVELGPNGPKVKLFGGDSVKLPDPRSLDAPAAPSIEKPSLPDMENLPSVPKLDEGKLLEELKKIEGEYQALAERKKAEISDEEKKKIEEQERMLEERKREIVRRLEERGRMLNSE